MTRVLITRPKIDGDSLAEVLTSHGIESVVSPSLEIHTLDRPPLQMGGVQAILVTSLNGARALGKLIGRRDIPVYAVGSATGHLLTDQGFLHVQSAEASIESLADVVSGTLTPEDGPLVHAGGAVLAGDLKKLLEEKGFRVRREVLYSADRAEKLTPDALEMIQAGQITHAVFFSPRSMESFLAQADKAGVTARLKIVTAVVLSAAVAGVVPKPSPWKEVRVAEAVNQSSLVAILTGEKQGLLYNPEDTTPLPDVQISPGILAAEAAAPAQADSQPKAAKPTRPDAGTPSIVKTTQVQDKAQKPVQVEAPLTPEKEPEVKTFGAAPSRSAEPGAAKNTSGSQAVGAPGMPAQDMRTVVVKKRGLPMFLGLPLAVIAGAGGALAVPYVTPYINDWMPAELEDMVSLPEGGPYAQDLQAVQTRVLELEQELARSQTYARDMNETVQALMDFVTDISVQPGAGAALTEISEDANGTLDAGEMVLDAIDGPTTDLAPVLERLAAVEEALATFDVLALDAIQADMEALKQEVVRVFAEAQARAAVVEGALERRDTSLNAMVQRLDDLERDRDSEDTAVIAALRVAVMKQAADQGEQIGPALEALRFQLERAEAVAQPMAILDSLATVRVPTRFDLRRQFDGVIEQTLSSVGAAPQSDWFGRFVEAVQTTIIVRRRDGHATPQTWHDQVTVAEMAVQQGDFAMAVQTMETLPAYTQPAWQNWVVGARQRLALDNAIYALERHVTRLLVGDDS